MNDDYKKARRLGLRRYNEDLAKDEDPYLPALDEIIDTNGLRNESLGIIEVPIDLFAGTKTAGRQNAFAGNFLPIMKEDTEFAYKWMRLYDAQINEGIRDPVKCYEYEGKFYVEEGNKRVSVLKYLDVVTVVCDAYRTLAPEKTPLYEEFLEFYKVAPTYVFSYTIPGSYRKMASYFGLDLKERWNRDVLNRIQAGYYRFSTIFKERVGEMFGGHIADAYLVYLSFYSPESLLDYPKSVLKQRVGQIMPEFLSTIEKEKQRMYEDPSEAHKEKKSYETVLNILTGPTYTEKNPLNAAFLYRGDPKENAWLAEHEEGRKTVQSLYGKILKTRAYMNYHSDEQLSALIDKVVKEDTDVIFTVSSEDLKETLRASLKYPKLSFYNCSLKETHKEVATYYIKVYGAKFLLGCLAAMYAKDHKIGYIAHYPIYGAIANINAFAIGAAMIDPQAKVYLKWATTDTDWRAQFKEEGISVISAHDTLRPDRKDEENGLVVINEDGSWKQLARPVYNWGRYYELILEGVLNDNSDFKDEDYAINYWYGLSSGVVDVQLSSELSYYSAKLIAMLKDAIINSTMDPFAMEINSQDGQIQPVYMPKLSNEEIISMDWLNDNVIGTLPKQEELNDEAKNIVAASGVEKVKRS